ncbi:MAG: GxxExxY protein [Candidatus Paceibacteria bacterium]
MHANNTNNKNDKLIYPELSYKLTGICFEIHNELGRFARERQYCDLLEDKFKLNKINYNREIETNSSGNRLDFLIEDKLVLEIKAKQAITKADYFQTQRYLQQTEKRLGLLINFRSRYLKPVRVIKIDTDNRQKFQ